MPSRFLGFEGLRMYDLALVVTDIDELQSKSKQDIAQALSARINEAYQCLLNPLSRAEYLLEQHHVPISETDQVDDIEFMSDIMQARETIEEAEDGDEVANLLQQNSGSFTPFKGYNSFYCVSCS
ncbi:hypothetical protein FPV67DRAFT_1465846 [Lyophyllum atratum]|nr:hypothetical protein FPV67DRAFT_1465846 [Lyophyllum atratum]